MAKAKVILFDSKTLKDNSHPLMLRITNGAKRKYYSIGISLHKSQWDKKKNTAKGSTIEIKKIKLIISDLEARSIQEIYQQSQGVGNLDLIHFEEKIFGKKTKGMVLSFFKTTIDILIKSGKSGNANAYKNTFGVFSKFRKGKDLLFTELNYREIKKFENFLLERGLSTNGISFHMRTLRALFNRAIKEDITSKDIYPFDKYSIKKEKTKHRALSIEEMSSIKNFNTKGVYMLQLAKDYFMFSFYMRGISFIDIAYLKVNNIHKGRLDYKRAKTGGIFNIEMPDEAIEIIKRYNDLSKKDSYIFPAIKSKENLYKEYKNALRLTNKKLKIIGELVNCSIPLTSYVARHSWATIAKRAGMPTPIIGESLGHGTEEVTQIYLDSFENKVLDEANKNIIKLI